MQDNTFIKYTRSLHNNPIFKSMSLEYRHIFMTILVNMAFKPIQLNDHGVLIDLKPGQFMTTLRELVKLCDEEGIDKRKIERALIMFEKVGFSRQETGHRKTIITVTESSICESLKNENGTSFGTKTGQERDKNGTQKKKEKKEEKEKEEHTPPYPQTQEIPMEAKRVSGGDFINSFSSPSKEIHKSQNDHKFENDDEIEIRPLPKTVELKQKFGVEEKIELTYNEYQKLLKVMEKNEFDFWVKQLEIEIERKGLAKFNEKNKSHYGAILAYKEYRDSRDVGFKIHEVTSPEENIKHAEYTEKEYSSQYYRLDIFRDRVEFTPHTGNTQPRVINFSDKGFKDQFQSELFKKGFKKK